MHPLGELHGRLRDSHSQLAKMHKSADEVFGGLHESMKKVEFRGDDDDLRDELLGHLETYGALHKKFAAHHAKEAEFHGRAASEYASKAAGVDLLEKVAPLPTGVRAIPIIRPGQPDIRTSTTAIDPAFAKMLGFDEEEQ